MILTVLLPQPLVASEKLNAGVVCTVGQYADSVGDTGGPFYALVIREWLTLPENWSQMTTKEYGGGDPDPFTTGKNAIFFAEVGVALMSSATRYSAM
jgi:hypothetical protein